MKSDELDIPQFLRQRRGERTAPLVVPSKPEPEPEPAPIEEFDLFDLPDGLRWAETAAEEGGFAVNEGVVPKRWCHELDAIYALRDRLAAARQARHEQLRQVTERRRAERAQVREMKLKVKERMMTDKQALITKYNELARAAGKPERKYFQSRGLVEAAIQKLEREAAPQPQPPKEGAKKKNGPRVRAGTTRERVLRLADGTHTTAQIAGRAGIPANTISTVLYCLKRDSVIDSYKIENDRPTVKLHKGVTLDEMVYTPE